MREPETKTLETPITTGAEGHFKENTAKTEPKTPESPITTGADSLSETAMVGYQSEENVIADVAAGGTE